MAYIYIVVFQPPAKPPSFVHSFSLALVDDYGFEDRIAFVGDSAQRQAYEIGSDQAETERVHCQGSIFFRRRHRESFWNFFRNRQGTAL